MSSSDSPNPGQPSRGFVSYSLNFEDVILNRLFPKQRHGFFVDVGAGHPRYENDLYALYDRGWTGINIEPNEKFAELHRQVRPRDQTLCIALSDTPGEPLTYFEIDGSGLSTCDEAQAKEHATHGHPFKARSVPVSTLADVLTEAGVRTIDILKVDVEGFEEKVLSGNDWERFRPSVVLVEATFPESRERRPTNIRGFMEQRGYQHVLFDGLNDFYLEHSFAQPPGLTLPPNVFDGFVSREIDELRNQVASLESNFASAETYAHSLKAGQEAVEQGAAEMRAEHGRAMGIAEALATENRKMQQQIRGHVNETRRLRAATDQMRAEITVLNRLLEPLHGVIQHNNDMDRRHNQMVQEHGQTSREHADRIERLQAEVQALRHHLHSIYTSRSWLLTKPWRVMGRVFKRLGR